MFQDDECVTAMKGIPPGESWAWLTLQIDLTKHQQRRELTPGKVIQLFNFKATIMSLELRYPSIDCPQAN